MYLDKTLIFVLTIFVLTSTTIFGQTIIIDNEQIGKKNEKKDSKIGFSVGVHTHYPGEIEEFENGIGFGGDFTFLNSKKNPTLYFSFSTSSSYTYKDDISTSSISIITYRVGYGLGKIIPFVNLSKGELESSVQLGNLDVSGYDKDTGYGAGLVFRIPFGDGKNGGINLLLEYNDTTESIGFGAGIMF